FFSVLEINADEQIVARVGFGLDDIGAAFEELDARYCTGEAAAHSHTWSTIARGNAAANQHETLPTTPDCLTIDHRLQATLNAAGQAVERFWKYFAAHDWAALAETMADDVCSHDRRRVVNGGELLGRAAHVTNMRAVAEVGFEGLTSTVVASRGPYLALIRIR